MYFLMALSGSFIYKQCGWIIYYTLHSWMELLKLLVLKPASSSGSFQFPSCHGSRPKRGRKGS